MLIVRRSTPTATYGRSGRGATAVMSGAPVRAQPKCVRKRRARPDAVDVGTDRPLPGLLANRDRLGVRAASCLVSYRLASQVGDDCTTDELTAGLLQALFGADNEQVLAHPVIFEPHRTLALSARVECAVPLLGAIYPRATAPLRRLPAMAEVDDYTFQRVARLVQEFAPATPSAAQPRRQVVLHRGPRPPMAR